MRKIFIFQVLFLILLVQAHAQSAFFTSDSPRCVSDTMHFTPGTPGGVIVQESWDFGDGSVTTYLPPASFPVFATHVYASPGTYNVTRTVKFSGGNVQYSIQVQVMPLPVANFTISGATCEGQIVQFVDLSQTNGGGSIQAWSWNFGDSPSGANNTSTLQNPSHIFSAAGTYTVTLTVTNSNGCSATQAAQVTINVLPVANFSYTDACEGSPTLFTDLSFSSGGAIVSFSWNFGDGGTSSLSSPAHIYASYGVYNVTLTVVNSNGCTHSVTKPVTVNPRPVAAFSFPATNCTGSTVAFTDVSYIAAGFSSYIIQWVWDFGDGTPVLSISFPNNPNVVHTFIGSVMTHIVRLTVTTSNGCTAFKDMTVTSTPAPVANFTQIGPACEFQPVHFMDLSQTNGGGAIQSWNWNFGDPASGANNTAATQNPVHVFAGPGTFFVCLVIANINGCTDTICKALNLNTRPVSNFHADTVLQGTATTFNDLSYSGTGVFTSRLWEFGDGLTATTINPTHVYGASGIFMAKLTVTDNNGCAKDTTKPVVVLFNPLIGPPATRTVTNVIVASGETKCYNASQVITVAGNGTLFFVLSGGNATFIAGQKILFLPSTTIQPGGYMHGYIAPTGPWCVTPSMPTVAMPVDALPADDMPGLNEESGFKIFPNPTTGKFTLELQGEIQAGNVSVELYGILGEKMMTTSLNGKSRHEFSLSGKPAGVYFIRIITGNKSEIVKVLKN